MEMEPGNKTLTRRKTDFIHAKINIFKNVLVKVISIIIDHMFFAEVTVPEGALISYHFPLSNSNIVS